MRDDINRPYCHYCNELATHRFQTKGEMVDVCKTHAKQVRDTTYHEVHTQLALFREYALACEAQWRWSEVPTVWEGLMEFYKEWDYNNTSCSCSHPSGRCTAHPNTAKAMKRGLDKANARLRKAEKFMSHDLMFDPRYLDKLPLTEDIVETGSYRGAYRYSQERIERMGSHYIQN